MPTSTFVVNKMAKESIWTTVITVSCLVWVIFFLFGLYSLVYTLHTAIFERKNQPYWVETAAARHRHSNTGSMGTNSDSAATIEFASRVPTKFIMEKKTKITFHMPIFSFIVCAFFFSSFLYCGAWVSLHLRVSTNGVNSIVIHNFINANEVRIMHHHQQQQQPTNWNLLQIASKFACVLCCIYIYMFLEILVLHNALCKHKNTNNTFSPASYCCLYVAQTNIQMADSKCLMRCHVLQFWTIFN